MQVTSFYFFVDLGWMQRKTILAMSPTISIKEEPPGTINIKTTNGFKTSENVIVLGEEHKEILVPQVHVTVIIYYCTDAASAAGCIYLTIIIDFLYHRL